VTFPVLVGLLLATSGSVGVPSAPSTPIPAEGIQLAQVIFHSRVVVRIQTARVPTITTWNEKKGPHCINLTDIQGTAVIVANSVDIALRGGDRVRMRFERSCPGLDYYSGFYVVPNSDGKICAGRDVVRDRAGGECAIDKFRKLIPAK
jgi:hypothetical protein